MIAALRDPPPRSRLALVVEGGGMRGAVSGGMTLGLDELGLADRFDAAYDSSAGALNAMWLVSGRVRDGIPTWTEPALVSELIDRRRVLRARSPPTSTRAMPWTSTRASPTPGRCASRCAPRPRCPCSPGRPSRSTGAGSSTPGSRPRSPSTRRSPGARRTSSCCARAAPARRPRRRVGGPLSAAALRRLSPAVRSAFLTRAEREAADEALLARHDADPSVRPHILSVRPAPGSPVPRRLEGDVDVIRAGLEAGREAVHRALGGA